MRLMEQCGMGIHQVHHHLDIAGKELPAGRSSMERRGTTGRLLREVGRFGLQRPNGGGARREKEPDLAPEQAVVVEEGNYS